MSWLVVFACPVLTLALVHLSLSLLVGNPLPPIVSTITNAIAFAWIARERTQGHKGAASAMALLVSMLGFVLSFVLTFFLTYAHLGA